MAMLVYQRVRFSNYPHLWNAQPLLHAEEQILVPETLLARFMALKVLPCFEGLEF